MRDPPIWLRSHGGGNVDLHLRISVEPVLPLHRHRCTAE